MNVLLFDEYKGFLADYISKLPSRGRGEVNRLGVALGVHPTLVSQVLNGPKDFTIEQAYSLARYLGLRPLDSDYLILLVQKDRAGTTELRTYFAEKVREAKTQSQSIEKRIKEHRELNDRERASFYSSWIYSAVRLFTSIGEGQSFESILDRFQLSRQRTSEVLNFLVESGLCEEHDGKFRMGSQHTHLGTKSPFLSRHHGNWRVKALSRTDNLLEDELMFTSPFSVSSEDFLRIREEIIALIKSSSDVIKASPAEMVACLNIDLFRVDH